ncbi:MAG: DUF1838 family protein [Rhodospirillaceae bacterium]|nr:DUF1838 family protein [Rhodospirillaceae bacterium]
MQSLLLNDLALGRRSALAALVGAGAAIAGAGPARAATPARTGSINYADPLDNLYAFGKIWAGYDAPVIGGFHGLMYMRIGARRMVPIFGYTGTGILQARFEPAEGAMYIKSRETGYFTDLRTGDILETWTNPFTEETVEVYHFYNDLTAGKLTVPYMPRFALGKDSDPPTLMNEGTVFPDAEGNVPLILPFQHFAGDHLMLSWDYTHEYTNPVAPEGWPSYSTGPRISPSEHFTFDISKRDLEDRSLPTVRFTAGFSRLSQPWPFMKMGGERFKDAVVFGRMFSHKGYAGTAEVPPKVLAYIEKNAPRYLELPPEWPVRRNPRLDTWMAFAQDVPPENKAHPWTKTQLDPAVVPPTGLGARLYKP